MAPVDGLPKLTRRRQLDTELVERGLAGNCEQARKAIEAGLVTVSGAPTRKPSRLVAPDEPVVVRGPGPRYVGRGGVKLDRALKVFGVDVAGRRVLDAGSSTGGFTDCLLQAGAAQVVAVDVGRGQLDWRLRGDARVTVLERTDVRYVDVDAVGGPVDVLCADLAFISLRTVAKDLVRLVAPGGDQVLLVKPQFEVGRAQASRTRGVIRDPRLWREVLGDVTSALCALRVDIMGCVPSPVLGADGNVEFLLHARAPAGTGTDGGRGLPGSALDDAVASAGRTAQGD